MSRYSNIVEKIISYENYSDSSAVEEIINEGIEQDIITFIGDTTIFDYLTKFEEYLDNHDITLYDGWDDAIILHSDYSPNVRKFWFEVDLKVSKDTDLKGALRIKNGKESQNKVLVKKLKNGEFIVRFKILKRYLDELEEQNKTKAQSKAEQLLAAGI